MPNQAKFATELIAQGEEVLSPEQMSGELLSWLYNPTRKVSFGVEGFNPQASFYHHTGRVVRQLDDYKPNATHPFWTYTVPNAVADGVVKENSLLLKHLLTADPTVNKSSIAIAQAAEKAIDVAAVMGGDANHPLGNMAAGSAYGLRAEKIKGKLAGMKNSFDLFGPAQWKNDTYQGPLRLREAAVECVDAVEKKFDDAIRNSPKYLEEMRKVKRVNPKSKPLPSSKRLKQSAGKAFKKMSPSYSDNVPTHRLKIRFKGDPTLKVPKVAKAKEADLLQGGGLFGNGNRPKSTAVNKKKKGFFSGLFSSTGSNNSNIENLESFNNSNSTILDNSKSNSTNSTLNIGRGGNLEQSDNFKNVAVFKTDHLTNKHSFLNFIVKHRKKIVLMVIVGGLIVLAFKNRRKMLRFVKALYKRYQKIKNFFNHPIITNRFSHGLIVFTKCYIFA